MSRLLNMMLVIMMAVSFPSLASKSSPKFNEAGFDQYKDVLLRASENTGVTAIELFVFTSIESNFKGKAKNGNATGLTQIMPKTCRHLVKTYGGKYGISKNSKCKDPYVNAVMTAEYIKENKPIVRKSVKRKVTVDETWMAHFIGPQTAARVLTAKSTDPITRYVAATKGNESLLYSKGKPLSVGQFKALVKRKVDRHMKVYQEEVACHVMDKTGERIRQNASMDRFIADIIQVESSRV